MTESKLLDLNDCKESYKQVYNEMLEITLLKNPKWFRFLCKKSPLIQKYTGYNHWSRVWEYPWAYNAAAFEDCCRILDVGGGGSPFANYLTVFGHDCYVIDSSLRGGVSLFFDKNKSLLKNLRSVIYHYVINLLKINTVEGIHANSKDTSVKYFSQSAQCIKFPDNYFDRVFCLSVLEHISVDQWNLCIKEFERVLKPGGRLIITLDMSTPQADERIYLKLVDCCSLKLVGEPYYNVPISQSDKKSRHPGHTYETIGLVWQG